MRKRYYLDTNIWLDLYYQRTFSRSAETFMSKIICEKSMVLYSDLVVEELKQQMIPHHHIKDLLFISTHKLKKIHISKEQGIEARKLMKKRTLPFKDCLHAVLARDSDSVLVTRDSDFEKLKDIVRLINPTYLF